jgi:hypothetical protein
VWRQAQEWLSQEPLPPRRRLRTSRGDPCAVVEGADSPERIPRISRLMALALKFEQLMRQGVVSDYVVLATLGQVSRSRLSQIMNLLNLAADIQEQILFLSAETAAQCGICERSLRRLSGLLLWSEQRARWEALKATEPKYGVRMRRPEPSGPIFG